jgi:hypothetical protein
MIIDANLFTHVFHMGGSPGWEIANESLASTIPHDHSSRTWQITTIHHN